jgi:hypothetical protein
MANPVLTTEKGVKINNDPTVFPLYNNLIYENPNEVVLTSGSDLNRTSWDSWPSIISMSRRWLTAWRSNSLHQVLNVRAGANYGGQGSKVGWGFRNSEYKGVGLMPTPVPFPTRPMWNNLKAIAWGLQVLDNGAQAQSAELVQVQVKSVNPASFTPAGQATITETLL